MVLLSGWFLPVGWCSINRAAFLQPIPVPNLPTERGISQDVHSLSPWVAELGKRSFFFFLVNIMSHNLGPHVLHVILQGHGMHCFLLMLGRIWRGPQTKYALVPLMP